MIHKDKISRHHCPGCHAVMLAALGTLNVRCDSCGATIVETALVLDCLRTLFREKEDRRLGHAPLSTAMSGDMRPVLVGLALATENSLGLAGF
jgi:hypothetical protein